MKVDFGWNFLQNFMTNILTLRLSMNQVLFKYILQVFNILLMIFHLLQPINVDVHQLNHFSYIPIKQILLIFIVQFVDIVYVHQQSLLLSYPNNNNPLLNNNPHWMIMSLLLNLVPFKILFSFLFHVHTCLFAFVCFFNIDNNVRCN